MTAPIAYRTSSDGALRRIWLGHCDTGIGEMTALSTDYARQLLPQRRESGSRAGLPSGLA
jgi:hypothetical protein